MTGRRCRSARARGHRPGDVIVCRENDSRVETDPGHTLTNGDIFKVESIDENGARVRRVLEADPANRPAAPC